MPRVNKVVSSTTSPFENFAEVPDRTILFRLDSKVLCYADYLHILGTQLLKMVLLVSNDHLFVKGLFGIGTFCQHSIAA